jgi:uncharacterized protein with PIN domain
MTKGDSSKCKCPVCSGIIRQPLHQKRQLLVQNLGTEEGTVVCPHCEKTLYFWSGVITYVHLQKMEDS